MNSHLLALEELKDRETAVKLLEEYLKTADENAVYDFEDLLYQRAIEIYEAVGNSEKADFYKQELEKIEEEINDASVLPDFILPVYPGL